VPGPLGLGAVVVVPVAGDDAVVCAKHAGPINVPMSKTASVREIFISPIILNKVEIRKEKVERIRSQKSEVRGQTSAPQSARGIKLLEKPVAAQFEFGDFTEC